MKKIIKQGNLTFTKICSICGCEFEYEVEDITNNAVECPCCKSQLTHKEIILTKVDWRDNATALNITYAESVASSDPCKHCRYRNVDINLCEACRLGSFQNKIQ